jgi:hypothetical protein
MNTITLQSIELAEMVKGCTRLDKMLTHDVMSEFGIYELNEKMQTNETNWLQHVKGMENCR